MDQLFAEFKSPLIVFVLFVAAQSPTVRKWVSGMFPFMVNGDSTFNYMGIAAVGGLMAAAFYGANRALGEDARSG